MRRSLVILAVFIFSAFGANEIFAQKVQRLYFKRGAKQLVATGYLSGYKGKKIFFVRVRAGQTLKIEQSKSSNSSHYISVSLTSPDGADVNDSDASCNNRKEITPTVAGDYRIEVYECMKADAWRGIFRLKVRVE